MERCMLDIETLGVEPGCVILSIGAVKFNSDGVEDRYYANVDIESCEELGLTIEANTLQWWLDQSEEAQECLHGGMDITSALHGLKVFYEGCDEVWANSPSFDCNILEAAYSAAGVDVPWEYYHQRDFRTLEALPGVKESEKCGLDNITKHNALDDALRQAYIAQDILSRLEG